GKCWEIYGHDKAGKRVEIYFHPITGEIAEKNVKD
nr:PepSY domain-containing protein [Vitreoscilla sp.]